MALLDVQNLSVTFQTLDGVVRAVNGVNFSIDAGNTLAIIGESGSGKSQTAFAILGLLAKNGHATGSVKFNGSELLGAPLSKMNQIRGAEVSVVFQDPMTSLNPYMRISDQLMEVLVHHKSMTKSAAMRDVLMMLDAVEIPDAKSRVTWFPHEFSGGMRQRVMIAMSLLCKPKLLIADEPTTALDVTVQAQIIALFSRLQKEFGMAVILITHDLAVVAGFGEEVLVLYGGLVMEQGPVTSIFAAPSHPYTRGLLGAIPRIDSTAKSLATIPGSPPNMMRVPKSCPFEPRCQYARDDCRKECPPLIAFSDSHLRACTRSVEELT